MNAQLYLLDAIPAGARLLIVGGGTGWILEEIATLHPAGLSITYIDSSEKMIALSERRNAGNNKVSFEAIPVESVILDGMYDVVLTPFLLDNLTEVSMRKVCQSITAHLNPGGIWLYCDFEDGGKVWHKVLLKIMYLFFRLSCGIEASELPDVRAWFSEGKYKIIGERKFYKGFAVARVYKKL